MHVATPYGYKPQRDEDEGLNLWDWVSNTGNGWWHFTFGDVPKECIDFVLEQWHRFGLPVSADIIEAAQAGASAAFYVTDTLDPYALFSETSDVVLSDDWGQYAITLFETPGGPGTEADPEHTESFAFRPDIGEKFFQEALGKPGLKELPGDIGSYIDDCLAGHQNAEELYDAITAKTEWALKRICTSDGVLHKGFFNSYFEIAGWAGFLWLASPMSRDYRYQNMSIMRAAMAAGECLLIDGCIYTPDHYRKEARPPRSCHLCTAQTWCVEYTLAGTQQTFICEKCLNGDFPARPGACGTKFCRDVGCKHHPLHASGRAGSFAAARQFGQLGAMARSGSAPRISGPEGLLLDAPF